MADDFPLLTTPSPPQLSLGGQKGKVGHQESLQVSF